MLLCPFLRSLLADRDNLFTEPPLIRADLLGYGASRAAFLMQKVFAGFSAEKLLAVVVQVPCVRPIFPPSEGLGGFGIVASAVNDFFHFCFLLVCHIVLHNRDYLSVLDDELVLILTPLIAGFSASQNNLIAPVTSLFGLLQSVFNFFRQVCIVFIGTVKPNDVRVYANSASTAERLLGRVIGGAVQLVVPAVAVGDVIADSKRCALRRHYADTKMTVTIFISVYNGLDDIHFRFLLLRVSVCFCTYILAQNNIYVNSKTQKILFLSVSFCFF
nr:MAG TPA: hypothetical protein [Caudoviricetes sp.]